MIRENINADTIQRLIDELGYQTPALMLALKDVLTEYERQKHWMPPAEHFSNAEDIFQMFDIEDGRSRHSSYIKSGFTELDTFIEGWRTGDLHMIDSDLHEGKTRFVINAALNIARKERVLYYSFTENLVEVRLRVMKSIAKRCGHSVYTKFTKLTYKELSQYQLYIKHGLPASISAMIEDIKKEISENRAQIVFIDDCDAIVENPNKQTIRYEQIVIFQELKKLAKLLGIAIVITKRASDHKYNMEHHLDLAYLYRNGTYAHSGTDVVIYLTAIETEKCVSPFYKSGTWLNLIKHYRFPKTARIPIYDNPKRDYCRDLSEGDLAYQVAEEGRSKDYPAYFMRDLFHDRIEDVDLPPPF